MSKGRYRARVVIDVDVDLDELHFPVDERGALIWSPMECIRDYIDHTLIKGRAVLWRGLRIAGWRVRFSERLLRRLVDIMVRNLWEHPDDERGRELREKFASLEEAVEGVMDEARRRWK